MTQEFINVTIHYFVSHLLSNVGLDVILADTANIAFHTPWHLLCQSAVNQRQKNARWAHSQKTAGPLLTVSDWEEWLAVVQIYKGMKKVPGARCREDNARVTPSTFHFFDNLLAKVKVQWGVKSPDGGVIHLSHTGWMMISNICSTGHNNIIHKRDGVCLLSMP